MNFNNVIGVAGVAGSGKDTFVNLLQEVLPNVKRYALADELKLELNPTLKQFYGIDILNCSREEKALVRPVLVAHGKVRRTSSKGRHWINILNKKIADHKDRHPNDIICITDIRYDFFDGDEVDWVKKELGGVLVHIQQYADAPTGQRVTLQPPNADEAENDPKLIAKANYRVTWPRVINHETQAPNFEFLKTYVHEFIKYLNR